MLSFGLKLIAKTPQITKTHGSTETENRVRILRNSAFIEDQCKYYLVFGAPPPPVKSHFGFQNGFGAFRRKLKQ